MAAKTDYSAGLATLANGGTTITFSVGANLTAADIQPGDTFHAQNLVAIIATVTDGTHATLTAPWSGTALAAASYRLRYQPDGSRFTAALRDLVAAISGGTLAAFQALTGAANKLPYFNSASTMDLADITAAGRALLNTSGTVTGDQGVATTASGTSSVLFPFSSVGRALVGQANQSDMRSYLGVQGAASSLTALSGISTAADQLPYMIGGNASTTTLTNFARSILDDVNAAAVWTTLGNIPAGTVASGSLHWVVSNANHAINNVNGGALRNDGSIVAASDGSYAIGVGRRLSGGTLIQFYAAGAGAGSISTSGTTATFNATSDATLKENPRDFDSGAILDQINTYQFDWKNWWEGLTDGYGVYAQETYEVFPHAVTKAGYWVDEAGEQFEEAGEGRTYMPWCVDYSKFVPLLLREVKGLRQRLAVAGI